jgi:hypothetical protein
VTAETCTQLARLAPPEWHQALVALAWLLDRKRLDQVLPAADHPRLLEFVLLWETVTVENWLHRVLKVFRRALREGGFDADDDDPIDQEASVDQSSLDQDDDPEDNPPTVQAPRQQGGPELTPTASTKSPSPTGHGVRGGQQLAGHAPEAAGNSDPGSKRALDAATIT